MDIKTCRWTGSRCGHQDFSMVWIKTWTLPEYLVGLDLSKPVPWPKKLCLAVPDGMLPVVSDVHFACFTCSWPQRPHRSPRAGREACWASLAPYNFPEHGCYHFLGFCEFSDSSVSCVYTRKKYILLGTIT